MSDARRVGVYGGAFDPPHAAHVALARAAVDQLGLDELRMFPTGDAWHKARVLSPAADRVAMARIGFSGLPRVVIDEREIHRPGPTYTVDTLRQLRAELPGAQLFLVIGEDQLAAFTSWRAWEEILRMVTLAVARRASGDPARTSHPARAEPFEGAQDGPVRTLPPDSRVQFLDLPDMPISATDIRCARAARSEGIDGMVPPGVASYIASHHLYRPH